MSTAQDKASLRNHVVSTVMSELSVTKVHVILISVATVIATIGMLQDSATVVIGAMLISPLFWPIMGLGVSFTTGKITVIKKNVFALAMSILLVIGISMLLAWIVPGQTLTSQIISRTQPTLLDLVIALAAATIGTLAVVNPAISTSTGVAISISLLPPLSVFGIALVRQEWSVAGGALLLFCTNMVAIVFATVITFYLLGLVYKTESASRWSRYGLSATLVLLILLTIPLAIVLHTQVKQSQVRSDVFRVINQAFLQISSESDVEIESFHFPQFGEDQLVEIKAEAIIPEGLFMTEAKQSELLQAITQTTGHPVELKLNILNRLSLRRADYSQNTQLRTEIEQFVKDQVTTLTAQPQIESLNVSLPQKDSDHIVVALTLKRYEETPLTLEDKTRIETLLNDHFQRKIQLNVDLLYFSTLQQAKDKQLLMDAVQEQLSNDLLLISSRSRVDSVKLVTVSDETVADQIPFTQVEATLFVPHNFVLGDDQRDQLIKNLETIIGTPVLLKFDVLRFDRL